MVINACVVLAIYCPRCGNIAMHTLNKFIINKVANQDLVCECGWRRGAVVSVSRNQYLLDIACILCQKKHAVILSPNNINPDQVNKIYCTQENIELGFYGNSEAAKAAVAKHKHDFERLLVELEDEDDIKNPIIMIETLNKVHDIAERGGLRCCCGSTRVQASVYYDFIELNCMQCGGHRNISTESRTDLDMVSSLDIIELPTCKRSRRELQAMLQSQFLTY